MTTREFYLSIVEGNINEDVVAKATELLAKHDASNEKRKSADSKEKVATRERLDLVRKALGTIPMTADAIAAECDVTVGQARSALSTLVKEGFATKVETKIDKSRKMVYSLAE
jgi:Fic family protein